MCWRATGVGRYNQRNRIRAVVVSIERWSEVEQVLAKAARLT